MGRQKPTQMPFENKSEYTEWRPSETEDTRALRQVTALPETLMPALQAQFDQARRKSSDRWSTAYMGGMPEIARRALQANEQRDLGQNYMTAVQQSAMDANNTNWARKMALAEMTLGRPLQTNSSGYQSAFAPPGFWQSMALGAVQGAGQGAMAAF